MEMNWVTHLECALCAHRHEAGRLQTVCTECGKPLWVRYDLDALKAQFTKTQLFGRPPGLWRYREMLPVINTAHIVSLQETITPLVPAPRLAAEFGLRELWIKDESRLPTGSFKARGMALAVTMARAFGVREVATPTAGNAGGALAAYAARAGMSAWLFMPADTPQVNKQECVMAGAHAFEVDGLIDDCGALVAEGENSRGWFNCATLREPYRIEGKKTMGLELAEQLDWELPGVILYPTGGGTGLIGMWKAFAELNAMGWLGSDRRPRMIACQSEGCAPIVRAFENAERFADPATGAATVAAGIRVPRALGDFMILDAVRASGGLAAAAPEASILPWMKRAAALEGLALCPEAAVCLGVLDTLMAQNRIGADEQVILFNTGSATKTPEIGAVKLPRVHALEDL